MNSEQKGHKNHYVEETHIWSYNLFAESPCDQFPKWSFTPYSHNFTRCLKVTIAHQEGNQTFLNPTFYLKKKMQTHNPN